VNDLVLDLAIVDLTNAIIIRNVNKVITRNKVIHLQLKVIHLVVNKRMPLVTSIVMLVITHGILNMTHVTIHAITHAKIIVNKTIVEKTIVNLHTSLVIPPHRALDTVLVNDRIREVAMMDDLVPIWRQWPILKTTLYVVFHSIVNFDFNRSKVRYLLMTHSTCGLWTLAAPVICLAIASGLSTFNRRKVTLPLVVNKLFLSKASAMSPLKPRQLMVSME
jgi:hypothetical protein